MNEQVEFATISDREKYLFDLQGFLVVDNFLTPAEVQTLNEAVDANLAGRETGNLFRANLPHSSIN